MSGRGKGGKVKQKAKSRSSRAGLQFPVSICVFTCCFYLLFLSVVFDQTLMRLDLVCCWWVQLQSLTARQASREIVVVLNLMCVCV